MGVTGVDRIKHFEEFNIEQGGPIVKNKLWFFGAFRQAYYDKPIANTFQTDGNAAVSRRPTRRAQRRRRTASRASRTRRWATRSSA